MTELWMALGKAVLDIVIAAISVATTVVVLPWIKNEAIPWLKDKHLYSIVSKYVKAAEKLCEAGSLSIPKKEYVVYLLEDRGIYITPEVDAFIESAVKELDVAVDLTIGGIADAFKDELIDGKQEPGITDAAGDPADEEVEIDVSHI